MPLADAIAAYREKVQAGFHIHAHRGTSGIAPAARDLLGEEVYAADLTELPGLDDLYHPTGVLLEAQSLAAAAFGSKQCYFLLNGTTSGNQCMLLATSEAGKRFLVDRNVHRSVPAGLSLAGSGALWLSERRIPTWEIPAPVSAEEIESALDTEKNIAAVFITSPNYYGLAAPVEEIARLCKERGIPLLVDEAHGAHFTFSEKLPTSAVAAGADLVAQSAHKTLGSLGQTSFLHRQGELVDAVRVERAVKQLSTSSPSYPLMASLDIARQEMSLRGSALIDQALSLAEEARQKLSSIPGLEVLDPEKEGFSKGAYDPLRICLSASARGISGAELVNRLWEEAGIALEMSDRRNALAVVSWGNTAEDADKLVFALRDILA